MKQLLAYTLAISALIMATWTPARADAWVDPPSFGRIVYGMTGGLVVLPQDAWQGAYPDGSGTTTAPNDAAFGGGALLSGSKTQYTGDVFGTPGSNYGYDFAGVGGISAVNAAAVTPVFGSGSMPKADIISLKLGFVSLEGWNSAISVYKTPSVSPLTTLFAAHTNAGSVSFVSVGDPFGLAYTSSTYGFAYYSDNAANNTGSAADKLYNHMTAYMSSDLPGIYFVGFEDVGFDTAGKPGYRRFDYNDSVIAMEYDEVPEPAFVQMTGLLGLGALGLLRLRVRRS